MPTPATKSPAAILNASKLILKKSKIKVPPKAKTTKINAAARQAVFAIAVFSFFESPFVIVKKTDAVLKGFMIVNREVNAITKNVCVVAMSIYLFYFFGFLRFLEMFK